MAGYDFDLSDNRNKRKRKKKTGVVSYDDIKYEEIIYLLAVSIFNFVSFNSI